MTIDRIVLMAVEPLSDPVVQLSSLDFPGEVTVDLTHRNPAMSGDWGDYLRAAATVLRSDEHSPDMRLVRGLESLVAVEAYRANQLGGEGTKDH